MASRDGPDRSMRHGPTPDGGRGPAQQLPLRPLACPGLTLATPPHTGPPEPPSHAAQHSRGSAKLSDGPFKLVNGTFHRHSSLLNGPQCN